MKHMNAQLAAAFYPLKLAALLLLVVCVSGEGSAAQTAPHAISVDICNAVGMRPADSAGAGAHVGNWNNLHRLKEKKAVTLTKVVDQAGQSVRSMTITVTGGSSAFGINVFDTPEAKLAANDARLYDGVFDQDNGSATVLKITGIPFAHYDVYFYRSDDGVQRAGKFTVGAVTFYIRGGKGNPSGDGREYVRSKDISPESSSGVAQGNYVEFENVTGRTLEASFAAVNAGDKIQRNKVAGFQIVERK